jgi:hypothetical protein
MEEGRLPTLSSRSSLSSGSNHSSSESIFLSSSRLESKADLDEEEGNEDTFSDDDNNDDEITSIEPAQKTGALYNEIETFLNKPSPR